MGLFDFASFDFQCKQDCFHAGAPTPSLEPHRATTPLSTLLSGPKERTSANEPQETGVALDPRRRNVSVGGGHADSSNAPVTGFNVPKRLQL
ncbi:hypothetical protein V5799_023183 [Amblyomma americanum]|uniref:Uncharacterized protein n=1 Tax=Amblyomma americanum TaxID=6943 RepID=A0AAQ4FKC9_AMBAM